MRIKILFIAILCSFNLAACISNEQSTKTPQTIEMHEMISFSEQKPNTQQEISIQDDILAITHAVNSAKKMDGVVDIADPHYQLNMGNHKYYLWVNPDHTATIMNVTDTNTIYRIYNAEKVISIIQQ